MSLYQCDECGSMENTTKSDCNGRMSLETIVDNPEKIKIYKQELGLSENEEFGKYCSACCPIGERKWHGAFARVYLPKGEFYTGSDGNLWHKEHGKVKDIMKYAIKIERQTTNFKGGPIV